MLSALLALAAPVLRVAVPAIASYVAHRGAAKAMHAAVGAPNRKPDSINVQPPDPYAPGPGK